MDAPKFAPKSPVRTTAVTAREISAPNIEAIAIAKGEVMFRDSKHSRIVGLEMPRSLTAAAVPYKPPSDDTRVDAPTVEMFSFISFFLLYIDSESAITAGPSRKSNTSPAPAINGVSIPALYDFSTVMKVDPVSIASTLAVSHVTLVHVMRGWTNLVKLFGRLAPNTKPESVVNRRNNDCNGFTHFDEGNFLMIPIVSKPVVQASDFSVRNRANENGLAAATALPVAGSGAAEVSDAELSTPDKFCTQSTEYDVLNKVKKKPPIITVIILSISYGSPSPLASGNVIRLGTKKTGSHFASKVAPGFNS